MTEQELLHCLEINLKNSFKGEVCYVLAKRCVRYDKQRAKEYFFKALNYFGNDPQEGVRRRIDMINGELAVL